MAQLCSSVCRCETPLYPAGLIVSRPLPRGGFCAQLGHRTDSSIQTLTAQGGRFDFGHVEPATIAGRVMDLQTPRQTVRFRSREGLVERRDAVGIEVIAHQLHLARIRVVLVQQPLYLLSPVDASAAVPATRPPPSTQW